jgi:uncharacterized damage-inducible protein DinB
MKPMPGAATTPSAEFIAASRTLLAADFLPKLLKCASDLSEDDLWWRPNEASNSVGNLLLHVCGNLRQWIVGGAGGGSLERDREAEFGARGSRSKAELISLVETTAREVDRVLADLREDTLMDRIEVQGFDVTRLQAVYHSIEHFSYHLGQIAYVTKLRSGKDLGIFP